MIAENSKKIFLGSLIFLIVYSCVSWMLWFTQFDQTSTEAIVNESLAGSHISPFIALGGFFMTVSLPAMAFISKLGQLIGMDTGSGSLIAGLYPSVSGLVFVGLYILVLYVISLVRKNRVMKQSVAH